MHYVLTSDYLIPIFSENKKLTCLSYGLALLTLAADWHCVFVCCCDRRWTLHLRLTVVVTSWTSPLRVAPSSAAARHHSRKPNLSIWFVTRRRWSRWRSATVPTTWVWSRCVAATDISLWIALRPMGVRQRFRHGGVPSLLLSAELLRVFWLFGGTAAAAPPPSGLATLPSVGAVP